MAKRKDQNLFNMIGLGLAAYGIYSYMRARKSTDMAGWGAPLDDDSFHGADSAQYWYYYPGSPQINNVIPFPKKDGYLDHIGYTPMGPVMGQGQKRYPGLSHQQVLQIKLHQHQQQQAEMGGYGAMLYAGDPAMDGYGAYGDACSRLERKYKKQRKKARKKGKQFERRGRRFLGIRVGDGSKRLAKLEKKYKKTRDKAISKGCEWPTRAERKRERQAAEADEARIEQQMQQEFETAQANIAETSARIAAESGENKLNPLVIIGGVGLVAVAIFALTRKKSPAT